MICHVLPHTIAPGVWQMGMDQAMMERADEQGAAFFRTYQWRVPTLSLGWFQKLASAQVESRFREAPIVRRPTGGGAIWHDHDLTYALAMPRAFAIARAPSLLYKSVHGAILEVFAETGLKAALRGESDESPRPRGSRPFLCFADADPEDVVASGSKIVGSAQRRSRGAVLIHGSLLLASSLSVPELPGLGEISPLPQSPSFWSDRLIARLPRVVGEPAFLLAIPDRLAERAVELEQSIYSQSNWTQRR